jgi:hypothetical protein
MDNINPASPVARLSLALLMIALSHVGPPTRIALTMTVMMPSGAMAKMMLLDHPRDSDMNCCETYIYIM